jgi:predicted sulfurtransferase
MPASIKVINFYHFFPLKEPQTQADRLQRDLAPVEVLGTITLAQEGCNISLAGSPEAIDQALAHIADRLGLGQISYRSSYGETQPFKRLMIKVKDQILAFPKEQNPSISDIHQGPALSPDAWPEILDQPTEDTVILDTRNVYEVECGSFEGADHLGLDRFQDFPKAFLNRYGDNDKDKTFLMFCTGGIRCEKAVAFAQSHGFRKTYKLDGGIIDYFANCGDRKWQGECFVFDHRWTIRPDRQEGESFTPPKKSTCHNTFA